MLLSAAGYGGAESLGSLGCNLNVRMAEPGVAAWTFLGGPSQVELFLCQNLKLLLFLLIFFWELLVTEILGLSRL